MCSYETLLFFSEFGPTSTLAYLMSGLKPFTSYQFRLSALSSYGSTVSAWITAKTAQDSTSCYIFYIVDILYAI